MMVVPMFSFTTIVKIITLDLGLDLFLQFYNNFQKLLEHFSAVLDYQWIYMYANYHKY
jgi:hypothetical protein